LRFQLDRALLLSILHPSFTSPACAACLKIRTNSTIYEPLVTPKMQRPAARKDYKGC
jgi:hypothetical protein